MTPPSAPEVPKKTGIQGARILKIQENMEKPGELEEISTDDEQPAERDEVSTEEDEGWYNTIQEITIKKSCEHTHWIIYTETHCQKHIKQKVDNN